MAELKEKEIDGVKYTVSSESAGARLERDIREGKEPVASQHRANLNALAQRTAQTQRNLEKFSAEEADRAEQEQEQRSGSYRAFVSGLTNDEAYQMNWLGEKRFPELADQINFADYYFLDKDNDIAYIHPVTGDVQKEFKDGLFGTVEDTMGLIGPTLTFIPEVFLGGLGVMGGASIGNFPGAVIGGGTMSAVGTGVGAAARQGLSALLDGPPINLGELASDMKFSAATGSIPVGAGFFSGSRPFFRKFSGENGRNALRTILTEGGQSVDEMIERAASLGFTLTRAEAQLAKSNAGAIQRYLQMMPAGTQLFDFYNDRALRMTEVLDDFFDEISSLARTGSAPEQDLADAAARVLKKNKERLKARADQVYENAFKLGEEENIFIDISAIGQEVRRLLDNPNIGPKRRRALQRFYDSLRNPLATADDMSASGFKSDTRVLHDTLTEDLSDLFEEVAGQRQKGIARTIAGLKSDVSKAVKAGNPLYAQAADIYSYEKGAMQLLERGFLNNLVKAAKAGNGAAIPLVDKMFKGKITAAEIRSLKEMITAEDPNVWRGVTANWLRTQLDNAVLDGSEAFGVPNQFLTRIGIKNPNKAFAGRGGSKRLANKIAVFREILGPETFEDFKKVLELTQAVQYISRQGGSITEPLRAMGEALQKEAKGRGPTALVTGPITNLLKLITSIPSRVMARGFDDLTQKAIGYQKETYEDLLIQALIDPDQAELLRQGLDAFNPYVYVAVQSAARGTPFPTIGERETQFDREGRPTVLGDENLELRQRMREMETSMAPGEGAANMTAPPPVGSFAPLPVTPTSPIAMSPTPALLPNEEDRLIAMRRSGVAGLI